jgi:hypothetical protein
MSELGWRQVPVGLGAQRWLTRDARKIVLVAAHTLVSTQRLMDVIGLVETDHRIQLVFSKAPAPLGDGVSEYLDFIGALRIPWAQAVRERFDLALTAAYAAIDEVHAPVLVMAHGAGWGKRSGGTGQIYGLDAGRLVRDGKPVPAALMLSHDADRDVLVRQCPEALDIAVVAGDPCYDRMVASLPFRDAYRRTLGVDRDCELVVIASTWGTHSLLGRLEHYLPTVMKQLNSARYRVALLAHPNVWHAHGSRQLKAWLSDARAAGLTLIEPDVDWRAAVVAADYVIGDHGSTTAYSAVIGTPVVCTDLPLETLNPASVQASLGMAAPRLSRTQPLEQQLEAAADWQRSLPRDSIAARLTSRPGEAHRLFRREMYRLLGMSVPGRHRAIEPISISESQWRS